MRIVLDIEEEDIERIVKAPSAVFEAGAWASGEVFTLIRSSVALDERPYKREFDSPRPFQYLSFAKNRSDQKPCSIRALANEMNRLTGGLRLLADNHVTQRYMPAHPASVVLENRSLSMWKRES